MSNLRWLWKQLAGSRLLLLGATLLMTLESLAFLSQVGLQQRMIDDVLLGGQVDRFVPTLLLIGLAYAGYSLLFTFGPHVIHLTVARVRARLARQLMQRLYAIPIGLLRKERTASYVYHFTNDLTTAANTAGGDLPRLFQQLTNVVVLLVVLFLAGPGILAAVAAFSLLYLVLGRKFPQQRKEAAGAVNRSRSALLVHLEEGVSATREVVAFHRQAWEDDEYNRRYGAYYDTVMTEGKLINRQLAVIEPLRWGAVLAVLLYGGHLVLSGSVSIGMFVITYQFTNRFLESFHGLYQYALGLSAKLSSVERLRGYLEGESLASDGEPLSGPIASLRLDGVTFSYASGLEPVLRDVRLELPVGRKLAFVGGSGGGKSTLAQLLVRFHEPGAGQLTVNGRPLSDWAREDWMSRVTIVFQEPYLFPDTIRANLLLGREGVSEETLTSVCQAMQIHDVIAALPDGYDTVIGERGVTLSGGQKQRLALARALLGEPEVLILDEATSALDLETERRIQQQLDRLRAGRTTLIIAHRLSTIRNADAIFVFDRGRLAESGTHEELLARGSVYRELVWKEERQEREDVPPAPTIPAAHA
ncbi:ABC transporter ATP-binding protein [Paenibacillus sp. J31TS4]|uniref:ABC transporter ATP-binding protein n=1 Tax=Paenibacillus sp. J31TS4 TaxID=2807195 RepID=UPI001B0F8922|nr:ABC transporter ATP-binding protein [Paenibacillus sp. J31TS4]GIP39068.1 ABC transporter ATP-binding protein [Paenibacillus sp. J31TS4]